MLLEWVRANTCIPRARSHVLGVVVIHASTRWCTTHNVREQEYTV